MNCVVELKGGVEAARDELSEQDREMLHGKADELINFLYRNKSADLEEHHYAEKLKELERLITPINAKLGGNGNSINMK